MPKFHASCKFHACFQGSTTKLSYTAKLPAGMALEIARIPVKAFRQTMAETYPELPPTELPKLCRITITITLP